MWDLHSHGVDGAASLVFAHFLQRTLIFLLPKTFYQQTCEGVHSRLHCNGVGLWMHRLASWMWVYRQIEREAIEYMPK